MTKTGLTIWCNNAFSPQQEAVRDLLVRSVGPDHEVLFFAQADDGREGESHAALQRAEIAFGFPHPPTTSKCEQLRWIHLHSAGYTGFDLDDVKRPLISRGAVLTNSSAVYDEPCAQHLLAMIVALARELPAALDVQRGDRTWPMHSLRSRARLLNEQTVLLLGYGAIARRLAELLSPLQMKLTAVRREVRGDEKVTVFESSEVDRLLPQADHVVNVLPANEETRNFLNAERLAMLKHGAIVYNIGRGTTLDQDALIKELNSGRVAAAYLDVMDPEPLPPDHPLWRTPNCFITPHVGGGHDREKERQVVHFLNNLRRFEKGETLHNRIW